jgi:molybdopterin-guanine dinucleotide biosynthesis protein A
MISCIILAGGEARRMQGQDKGLVHYRQRPLIEHVLERVRPQVDDITISANRNLEQYANYAARVVTDTQPGFSGPLAGIASCLPCCRHELALVVACDMPLLPHDLVACLSQAIADHDIAIISCDSHQQLALLVKTGVLNSITAALSSNQFRLLDWVSSRNTVAVEYSDKAAFANLNTLNDLEPGS